MRVRRLGWAGVEIEADDGHTAVIDLVEDTATMVSRYGLDVPFHPPSKAGHASVAAVTHLHADHADCQAVRRAMRPEGVVLRPEELDRDADVVGIDAVQRRFDDELPTARQLRPWDRAEVGPFVVVALPAADGLGAPQLSWLIEVDGRRILHAGDTMFHGYWWLIARRCGPVDVAFLPINGAVVHFAYQEAPPSPLPAMMTPLEAAVAAQVIDARLAIPIHYGLDQPRYRETADPVATFRSQCDARGVRALELQPTQWHDVPEVRR